MSVQTMKRLFTVDEYYRMVDARILSENDRVELIEGEITQMTPIGSYHSGCVKSLNNIFFQLQAEKKVTISVQDPVRLSEFSEPEPDVVLLKHRNDFYRNAHPSAEDIFLIIEVADTTLDFDRLVKIPLYAKHGIPESWIVDVKGRKVEAFWQPESGKYVWYQTYQYNQSISLQAFPDFVISVSGIFG